MGQLAHRRLALYQSRQHGPARRVGQRRVGTIQRADRTPGLVPDIDVSMIYGWKRSYSETVEPRSRHATYGPRD